MMDDLPEVDPGIQLLAIEDVETSGWGEVFIIIGKFAVGSVPPESVTNATPPAVPVDVTVENTVAVFSNFFISEGPDPNRFDDMGVRYYFLQEEAGIDYFVGFFAPVDDLPAREPVFRKILESLRLPG
jgi:hypothetical protein